jgi:hypothetical protein
MDTRLDQMKRPGPKTGPDLRFRGADDGIRTRDPHLGKAAERVYVVTPRAMTCGSVRPVVRRDAVFPPCRRALY